MATGTKKNEVKQVMVKLRNVGGGKHCINISKGLYHRQDEVHEYTEAEAAQLLKNHPDRFILVSKSESPLIKNVEPIASIKVDTGEEELEDDVIEDDDELEDDELEEEEEENLPTNKSKKGKK